MVDVAAAAARALNGLRRLVGQPLAEWLAVTVVCAGLAGGAAWNGWLWRVDSLLYDAAMATQRLPADPAVAIVAIDDHSLAEIGRWPWPRAVHAALIEQLAQAGADVVALDIILAESDPEERAGDAALARAMAAHGRVVLPVTHGTRAAASAGEALPAAPFAEAAAALGHIHIELDPDGIARSAYLWEGMGSARHPQLALAALQLYDPAAAARAGRPPADDRALSGWRRDGWFHIPFIGPPGSFRYLSYADVLRGELPPGALAGAVVLVGASAVGMGDIVPTPTSGHARPMPGVEVHANVFNALRQGIAVVPVGRLAGAAFAVLAVAGLLLAMLRAGPRFTLVVAFAVSAAVLAGSWALLALGQLWLPPAGALAGCLLAYPLWSWRRLEAAQRYLDTELAALRGLAGPFDTGAVQAAPPGSIDPFRARIAVVRDAARRERILQRFVADTLDALPVGVLVADPAGRIRLANRRAADLLGSGSAEAQGEMLAAMPWPAGQACAGGLPMPAAGGGCVIETDQADGGALMVSVGGLYDEQGGPLGAVFGLSDIAPIRAAQRSREDLMYFLSHDLRAPLASILTLLDGHPAAGDMTAGKARLEGYARQALGMADKLLRLARAEALQADSFSEVALEMLLMDAADEVWALARGREQRVVTRFAPGIEEEEACLVMGDRELLFRAVVNLLTNAIKYSPRGAEIRLALAAEAGGWAVAVQDSGCGIAPENLSRLFRRFGRIGAQHGPAVEGVGLGLLMVSTVAERHGGSVSVRSEEGAGSTFTLFLPALR